MRLTHFRRAAAGAAVAALAFGGLSAMTTAPAWAATSKVSVVHGIPGQPVDVYVNGEKTLDNFEPGTVAGPLDLEEGTYDLALTKPGEPIGSAILKADGAQVPGGANISIVAHLDADGQPKITPFVNDVEGHRRRQGPADRPAHRGRAGRGRARRRHAGVQGPHQPQRGDGRPRRRHGVGGRRPGRQTDPVLGPADLNLKEGTATIVYAIGSAAGQDARRWWRRPSTGLHSAPGGVPSGTGGMAGHRPVDLVVRARRGRCAAAARSAVRGSRPPRATSDRAVARGAPVALAAGVAALIVGGRWWPAGRSPRPTWAAAEATALAHRAGARPARRRRRRPRAADRSPIVPPVRLRIPAIDVTATVNPVGVDARTGDFAVPPSVDQVGWYRFGPGLEAHGRLGGDRRHVDSAEQGRGAFFRLRELRPGRPARRSTGDDGVTAAVPGGRPGGVPQDEDPAGPLLRPRRQAAADADHLRRAVRPRTPATTGTTSSSPRCRCDGSPPDGFRPTSVRLAD